MKPNLNCPNPTCELLNKMMKSADPYVFLDKYIPANIVMENLHTTSKACLECICCLLINSLVIIRHRHTFQGRLIGIYCKLIYYCLYILIFFRCIFPKHKKEPIV